MRIARLILLSLAMCVLGASVGFAETIATKDYWVLTDGYRGEFTNSGQVAVSYGPYGSYITEGVFDVNWPGTTGTTDQFFKYDAGRLVYYGARYVDSYGEYTYVPEAGQEFLPAVLEVGKSYTSTWLRKEYQNGLYIGAGRDTYTITVRGPFTTTVPAGSYTTYELNLTNNWETSSGSRGATPYTYYVAKGIGWVKMIRDGMSYELVSCTGPPAAPQLSVSTSGLTVTLSWTSEAGVTGYTLFYAPYPDASYWGSIDMGTQTGGSFVLGDCAFYVVVQAHNRYGSSAYSNLEYFVLNSYITPPTVTTGSATSVTSSSAILTGTVNPNGAETSYYFQYGTTTSYGSATTSTSAGSGAGSVSASATLTGLSSGTTYHYRLAAANSGGTTYGPDNWFTTTSSPSPSTYTNSLGMYFFLIPAGTFTMGSPSDEPGRYSDEGPQHQVTLTQPFYMQTTEVTQAQWEAVMGSNPSYFTGCASCPVEYVSWNDVQIFITEMNKRGEGTYSLPTEAQWEYAARAGSSTAFYNGGISVTVSGYDPNLDAIGWYNYNSGGRHQLVAHKAPNSWGLYDMSGNVYEWCQDWYGAYPSGAVTDPTGPSTGSCRVFRGGSWFSNAGYCRSAARYLNTPDIRNYIMGFRLVLSSGQ